jgi:hypothetical protein
MNLDMRFARRLLAAAFAVLSLPSAFAADASEEFSPTQNPSVDWSYGWSPTLGGLFVAFDQRAARFGLDYWYESITVGLAPGYPLIAHNPSGSDLSVPGATVRADQLVLHPGADNQYAVLRWVAPRDMRVELSADFTSVDFIGPTTSDVHVLVDGASIYDALLGESSKSAAFDGSFTVPKGTTVDFAVGYGSNRNYFYDGTGLFATIGPVPEPAAWLLMLLGLPLAASRPTLRKAP